MGIASPVSVAVSMVDQGAAHVERDAVFLGQNGDVVSADLVGEVAVGSDAVCADDNGLDSAGAHEAGGHVVADDGRGNAVGHQLPCGEARALQKGARLVGVDVNVLALLDGGANDTERGSVAAGGQCAGVAVSEHAALLSAAARRRMRPSSCRRRCLRRTWRGLRRGIFS